MQAGYTEDASDIGGGYYGTITLTIAGTAVTGTYTDQSGLSDPATGPWSLTLVTPAVTPADELCWSSATPVTSGSILNNHWANSTLAATVRLS
jgi:hypothetical protein